MIIFINKIHKRNIIFNFFHIEISHIHDSQFLIYFLSCSSPNSSNLSSKSFSFSINSTKLNASLQLPLESFGQFLLTKISFSRFFDCKWHLLRSDKSSKRKNMFRLYLKTYNAKYLLTISPTTRNLKWCFAHHNKRLLMSFTSTRNLLKFNNSLVTNSFASLLLLVVIWKMSNLLIFSS